MPRSTRTGDAVEVKGLAVDSRAVKPGDLFFALAGSKTDGARFIDAADCRRRRGGRKRPSPDSRRPRPVRGDTQSAPRAGAGGGEILSKATRDDSGGDRHQRQDVGRRLHAADLGKPRPCLRQHRHHRAGFAKAHRLRLADHAGSDRAASSSSTRSRARASPISRSRPPRTGSTSTGSTACASPPAALPICRATTWIIILTSRITSMQSCGCSAISSRSAAQR